MLVHSLTTILPAMTLAEAREITRLPGVAGCTGSRTVLVMTQLHIIGLATLSAARAMALGLWCSALHSPHVPTVLKILRGALHEELADDGGFRGTKLGDELLQLRP
jgi:hypothetical protein